ncbi:MAG: right-handed parallel beta-helix repeat-containing protein [Candidatus Verstraetearchaeota archaeon]|nr:right-handed parallel beta-helix repeat-containing protein [Candidatus Verstraetearchaeota archaeon]
MVLSKRSLHFTPLLLIAFTLILCQITVADAHQVITVPDDFPTIQKAINNASNGDTVLVKPGNYTESIVVNKSIILTSLMGAEHTFIYTVSRFYPAIYISASNAVVSGFTLKSSTTWYASALKAEDVVNVSISDIKGVYVQCGIEFHNASFCKVSSSTFTHTVGYAIGLDDSRNNTFTSCSVEGANYGVYLGNSHNNTFRNLHAASCTYNVYVLCSDDNIFESSTICNAGYHGFLVEFSDHLTIFNCTIADCARNGVDASSSEHLELINNTFYNCGVLLYYTYYNTIENNTVNNLPLLYFEKAQNINVSGPIGQLILINCSQANISQIAITRTSVGVQAFCSSNINIADSQVSFCSWEGMDLHCVDHLDMSRVTISNTTWHGAVLSYVDNSIVEQCLFTGNGVDGLHVISSTNTTIRNTTFIASRLGGGGADLRFSDQLHVYSCHFDNCNLRLSRSWNSTVEQSSFTGQYSGIRLYRATDNVIHRNMVDGGYGIQLTTSSTRNTITENQLFHQGLQVYDSFNNTVVDNTVNGLPIIYLEDEENVTASNGGQAIILHCNNITVLHIHAMGLSEGIYMVGVNNSAIGSSTILYSGNRGIYLEDGVNNTFEGITVGLSWTGVDIRGDNSYNNTFRDCTFIGAYTALLLSEEVPINTTNLYFNNFINNTIDVHGPIYRAYTPGDVIYHYHGKRFVNYLGNHWSSCNNTDADDDGIADTGYTGNNFYDPSRESQ